MEFKLKKKAIKSIFVIVLLLLFYNLKNKNIFHMSEKKYGFILNNENNIS